MLVRTPALHVGKPGSPPVVSGFDSHLQYHMQTHYMHNWVDMAVLLEIQQMNTVVVCLHMVIQNH